MSGARSWEDEWRATWLSDRAYVSALDGWVRRRMIAHHAAADREARHESVGPWTVDGLVSDVHRHASANHWLWATTSICFLQELLFCIDDGGVELSRHLGTGFADEIEALRDLRNVVAHPAKMPVRSHARAGEKKDHAVDSFCVRMERDQEFWGFAVELLGNWSLFSDRRVTRFALRRLNTTGRAYVRQLVSSRSVLTSQHGEGSCRARRFNARSSQPLAAVARHDWRDPRRRGRSFAIGFYGGLGEHESVAAAFMQGRAAIDLDGLPSEKPLFSDSCRRRARPSTRCRRPGPRSRHP